VMVSSPLHVEGSFAIQADLGQGAPLGQMTLVAAMVPSERFISEMG